MAVQIIGVEDITKCQDLSRKILKNGQNISMDAEGLSLSATGRLTLLQIGTEDGHVYVIDVVNHLDKEDTKSGKDLLEEGLIKDVLQSNQVLKIVHGCFSDSAALFHQFGIRLNQVFDTQCAHVTLEVDSGVKFPIKLPLQDIITKYGTTQHASKKFRDVWLLEKDYWLKRPLTEEAIKYASEDVAVLHELYGAMERLLKQAGTGRDTYAKYLDWELNQGIDRNRVHEENKARNLNAALEVLQSVNCRIQPCDFSGDQIKAFHEFRSSKDSFKDLPNFSELLIQEKALAKYELNECKEAIANRKLNQFRDGQHGGITLLKLKSHENEDIRKQANQLQMTVRKTLMETNLRDVEGKITNGTVKSYRDLNYEEAEAINNYQQFKYDEDVMGKYSAGIDRLEKELCNSELSEWETWRQENKLSEKLEPRQHGKLRSLSKHKDEVIKKRAFALNDEFKIAQMTSMFPDMIMKQLKDLNHQQKRALNTLREFRHKINVTTIASEILELESDNSREELEEWERWNQTGQLKSKAQGYERAVIRTLKDHPKPDISLRAKVLFDMLNPPRGQSGRGRGSGRGRRY